MDFLQVYQLGSSFEEFLNTDKDINREKILQVYETIQLHIDIIDRIKKIDFNIYILAFAEIWCPDCMINVPVLQKIVDINPKVQLKFLSREGNEGYMEKYKICGKTKIPTFVVFDGEFQEKGSFIETPKALKEILSKGNQVEAIIAKRKYRKGEYANETVEEILDIINQK